MASIVFKTLPRKRSNVARLFSRPLSPVPSCLKERELEPPTGGLTQRQVSDMKPARTAIPAVSAVIAMWCNDIISAVSAAAVPETQTLANVSRFRRELAQKRLVQPSGSVGLAWAPSSADGFGFSLFEPATVHDITSLAFAVPTPLGLREFRS
jgi:hypothetical protein